jgi:hypothetical protein
MDEQPATLALDKTAPGGELAETPGPAAHSEHRL